ncbi:MAG: gamma-glutamyl-gamma-aminobutyrate hydrolase family protein, partial [Acidobacteria bacterium]|nr:gamma-glutamyl-gamma-aminobutyrate hydrolase family protein [Acidobacteriota bacterium]
MKTTIFRLGRSLFFLFVLFLIPLTVYPASGSGDGIVIAMCQPTISQIQNIEQLYEKDIITLDKLKLIGIYHENESTDYKPAEEYVKKNHLTWVSFETIKGKVELADLFKKNQWTEQFRSIFARTNGIIFTGGWDIPPAIFGEEDDLLTEAVTPVRSLYEISFLFHLVGGDQDPGFAAFLETRPDYVLLGICLGAQSLNVAAGGSLYQDIPSQVYKQETVQQVLKAGQDQIHSSRYIKALYPDEKDLPPTFHRVKFIKDGICVRGLKMKKNDTPFVLTSHHQALKKLGKDIIVAATSMDGKIVEAVEHRKYKHV